VLSLTIYQKETLMANTKLLKVMDYLINEQEDKARELLHQIFIEKARAIHEEMMATEEPEMGGDMGDDFAADIKADQEAIDGEEHYNPMEGDEEDIDVDDAVEDLGDELDMIDDEDEGMEDADDSEDMDVDMEVDMDTDDADMDADTDASEDHDIKDLEQAIAELKAEFEALKSEVEGDEDHSEDKMDEAWESNHLKESSRKYSKKKIMENLKYEDIEMGVRYTHPDGRYVEIQGEHDEGEWTAYLPNGQEYESGTYYAASDEEGDYFNSGEIELNTGLPIIDHEDAAKEIFFTWNLLKESNGIKENVDLETVQAARGGEVGSGKFAAVDANKHSPVPTTQRDTMGAKPVITGKGPKASGYDRQSAPSAGHVGPATNRRKKAEDGMSGVSKEGSAKAMLNKDRSEGFGAPGTRSPIQGK
jgi:FKBP-type peptidyl-prolyl cis-trans isomerase